MIEEKTTPKGRAENEIAGYRDVLNRIHTSSQNISLNSPTLLLLHKEMMKYTDKEGGVWKSRDNAIFEYYPDGSSRVRFQAVPANLTPGFMDDLSTILGAYKEFESRIGKLTTGRGSKTEIILNAIDSFIGDFTISDLHKACPTVGRDLIRTILFRLRRERKLEPLGKGRYARWRKRLASNGFLYSF